jgi:DNA-binding transcriptional MerR regulator/effector-binding domain-containing protein
VNAHGVNALLTIGEFSRLTFLSVKALRHYHDVGILEPTLVDSSTGYRSYGTEQVPTAQLIRRLRELEMPLDDIRVVVGSADGPDRNDAVLVHLARMELQLERTAVAVSALRALLERPWPIDVVYRREPAVVALARRGVVDLAASEAWVTAELSGILRSVRPLGLSISGPAGALFPSAFFEAGEGELTAFVPVRGDLTMAADRFDVLELPETTVAMIVHEGAYSHVCNTYGALGSLVAEHGVGADGPTREYFLVTPAHTDDAAAFRTEVCWPVRGDLVPIGGAA